MNRWVHPALCWIAFFTTIFFVAGCANLPRPTDEFGKKIDFWQGRLVVRVDGSPNQNVSAGFELAGNAQQGQLLLFSPLGTTLAALQWRPGAATLHASGQEQQFGSLQELALRATGTAFPMEYLFAWLKGQEPTQNEWQVDLSQFSQGRVSARRVNAMPGTDIRILLEP